MPPELRRRLDAEARRQRRSRSFVVGEAIQAYLVRQERRSFGEARDRTLREGLALSVADRVKLAEELWRDLARGREFTRPWTAAFDTFDQYERWRRHRAERAR